MQRPTRVTAIMLTIISIAIPVTTLSPAAPAGAAASHVNLIRESEFDDVQITGAFSTTFQPGQRIRAWKVSHAPVAVSQPVAGIVTGISGRNLQFLSLEDPTGSPGLPTGKVCQRVDVVPSTSYKLRFYSAAATGDDTLIIRWQGRVDRFNETGSSADTGWTQHTVPLGPANASVGTLCFSGSGKGYPLLDAIRLFAVTS